MQKIGMHTQTHELPTALDLAELLHPTPAVGGWPRREALTFISDAGENRRFYAGTVGWCDAAGDGDWVVAIRCAELDPAHNSATAWAGGGIVADSCPSAEVQETRGQATNYLACFRNCRQSLSIDNGVGKRADTVNRDRDRIPFYQGSNTCRCAGKNNVAGQ